MHDAYEPVPILEKLPLQIDCLAAWEDWLLVGTKPGHLLLYRIKNNAGTNRFESVIVKVYNNIHVHDLLTFQQITVVSKARGATLFACDLQQSPSGEAQLRMCVAVKKKLQLYYWKDREFHELQGDFSAPDIPKAMAWCQNSICVGFKRDYYLIRVSGAQNRKHCVHLHYPNPLPSLSGAELEKAHLALIDYLTQKRSHLVKHLNDSEPSTPSPLMEGIPTIKSRKKLLQIIDTTLLKCYLHTNVALVSPLLRLDNNHCHIEESEYILKKAHKYSELIILYEKKGLHQKALQVLLDQSTKANSPLKGHERTVQYLQRLGMENLVIIFEFSPWVLKICPEDGLKVRQDSGICLFCLPCPVGVPAVAAGKEEGDLGEFRNKLLCFLEVSTSYEPGRLISDFPFDGLLEERAVLLGRMGKHEQALFIYVHVLKDTHMAEEYCHRHYDKETDRSQDVYLSLLRMYLSPPDVHCLGPIKMELLEPQTNLMAALHVLELHHSKLNTTKAIDLLPANTQIREIRVFLESVLEEKAQRKRFDQVLKSLLQAEFLRVQEERIFHQQVKCIITEEKTCRVCKKKIGNSAFARYPNGVVVHYFCCKDRGVCPTEQ
uniref:VPS39 subunit of HOPS complex n=1 Tax=Oncorhynchus kisutch TaxID=8019 RepID=A0A8C7CW37_ONCKI